MIVWIILSVVVAFLGLIYFVQIHQFLGRIGVLKNTIKGFPYKREPDPWSVKPMKRRSMYRWKWDRRKR